MLAINGLPGIHHDESEFAIEPGVFLHHFRSEMQIALEGIFQGGDVLSRFVKFDVAEGDNTACQHSGRRRKVKDEVGLSRGRVKLDCAVPVDSPRYITCDTCKNVAVREDD